MSSFDLIHLLTAGQDIHSEVKHLEERGEDGKDGVEHRAHPPLVVVEMKTEEIEEEKRESVVR